jgi:hypothetical protein
MHTATPLETTLSDIASTSLHKRQHRPNIALQGIDVATVAAALGVTILAAPSAAYAPSDRGSRTGGTAGATGDSLVYNTPRGIGAIRLRS